MAALFGRNREGKGEPAPKGGVRRYLFLIHTHFGKLVSLNLLFLLFSLPVVTLPAALCGLNRVLVRLVREGNCFLWLDFRDEFKGSFRKSLLPGLGLGLGLFAAYYLLSLGLSNGQSLYGMLFSAIGLALGAFVLLFGSWFFVLIAMLPLSNRDLLRNARALMGLEPGRSAAILGILLGAGMFLLFLFPLSLFPLVLILLAFVQYSICFLVNTPVQERIVGPYERAGERDGG